MLTRRRLLSTAALAAPAIGHAQVALLPLGILTPLTGAGAFDGPRMLKAIEAVVSEINGTGGVLGRKIALVVEDDETNPEAAVRAAHKLIDVNKVPVLMGTWASAVTTAVAPVCWESKTFLTTVSGADSITHLPHQGYLIRTQPNNQLQATKHAEFIIRHGAKRVFILAIQAPFAEPTRKYLTDTLTPKGVSVVGSLVYDKDKTSYRSEVDQALKAKSDFLYLNGYAPDVAVVLRDLYRAGYDGDRFCQSYALTAKSLEAAEGGHTGRLHRATFGRRRFTRLRGDGKASRDRSAGLLRSAGDRLDQHRSVDHRQGRRSHRHRNP
jgi:ABC-type branched-subunit amino acid transport system substrate-binding protein